MSENDLNVIESSDELRVRGKMNHSISTAKMPIGPFAAPASPPPAPRPTFIVEALPLSVPPLPQPEYSHCRTNKAHEQAMNSPLPSEFDQKRREFIKLFTSDYWNRPGENLDYLRKELQQSKALVIAVHYGDRDPLPATFVDAYNIVKILEGKFQYSPKTIRVLADRVGKSQTKDERWPNKENILKSLKWLNEGSMAWTHKLFNSLNLVAGHGYSLNLEQGGNVYTHEGILPRDFLTYPPYQEDEDEPPAPDVPDPGTVLFDDELNLSLVEGLADGARLTVIFDCCHSGGLTVLVPEFADMSHIRNRHLFAGQVVRSRSTGEDSPLGSSLFGNLLGLPSKINLANSNSEVTLDRAQIDDDSMDIEGITARAINMKFKPFPTNCQVVSWSACERGQLAREDGSGGRFTNTFMDGMSVNPNPGQITYRMLNRYIHDMFDRYNTGINKENDNKVRNRGEITENTSIIRASVNEGVEQGEKKEFQCPKLHVSANIMDTFADEPVRI